MSFYLLELFFWHFNLYFNMLDFNLKNQNAGSGYKFGLRCIIILSCCSHVPLLPSALSGIEFSVNILISKGEKKVFS